jgi:hypothetical protein
MHRFIGRLTIRWVGEEEGFGIVKREDDGSDSMKIEQKGLQ